MTSQNTQTPSEIETQQQGPQGEELGLETRPTRDLCHYTSQEGLIGILKSKAMYATDANYLNDSQEVVYASSLARRYFKDQVSNRMGHSAKAMLDLLDRTGNLLGGLPVYVASFSEESDLLSQWRGYCSKGPGFALCVSPGRITELIKEREWSLVKCIYDEARQIEVLRKIEEYAINTCSETVPPGIVFVITLFVFRTAFKHPKFKEESEWRVIGRTGGAPLVRPGASTLVPYINFPLTVSPEGPVELSKLVVGPVPHVQLALKAANILLQSTATTCPEPVSSEIPFRNW